MNRFQRAFNALVGRSIENPNVPITQAALTMPEAASGVEMDHNEAFTVSALYDGVLQISNALASYPKSVKEKKGETTTTVLHALDRTIREPNDSMTGFTFFHALMTSVILRGNGLAHIKYKGKARTGSPKLHLIDSDKFNIKIKDGQKFYDFNYFEPGKNRSDFEFKNIPDRDVIHVQGMSYNGWIGIDVVNNFADSLGLSKSQELFNSEFYKNGGGIQGFISINHTLKPGQAVQLSNSFTDTYGGPGNHHKVPVLGADSRYQSIGVSPEQAQFLQSRHFQVEDIARILNMPPHKLKLLNNANLSNIESQEASFHSTTMQPLVIRVEEELTRKLLSEKRKR